MRRRRRHGLRWLAPGARARRQAGRPDGEAERRRGARAVVRDLDLQRPAPRHREIELGLVAPVRLVGDIGLAAHLLHRAHRGHHVSDGELGALDGVPVAIGHADVEHVAVLARRVGLELEAERERPRGDRGVVGRLARHRLAADPGHELGAEDQAHHEEHQAHQHGHELGAVPLQERLHRAPPISDSESTPGTAPIARSRSASAVWRSASARKRSSSRVRRLRSASMTGWNVPRPVT